ncbi:MerR family transcriptional regulator [Microbacterium sp. 22242]|uniref:MerR family transcriptional regulator n=1 Tax=Microbacterium sp. 22242 TaxID=3453896 RepID=UPI003F855E49
MKLQELSTRSGTPVSTIKYYLREGLLDPGEKRNATTAEYDQSHVDRLGLIHALRQMVGVPVETVREVVDAVRTADPATVMGVVQSAVLGLSRTPESPSADSDADASDAPARLTAQDVVTAMGWSPAAADTVAALDRDLSTISRWGIRSDLETVLVYARAADTVARYELELSRGLDGEPGSGDGPTADRLATFVARGVYADSRLLLRLLAVAQASHAIGRG